MGSIFQEYPSWFSPSPVKVSDPPTIGSNAPSTSELPIPNKEDVGADATQLLTAIAQVGNDELASIGIAATQAFNSVEQAATQPVSDIASFIGNLGSDIASTVRITP